MGNSPCRPGRVIRHHRQMRSSTINSVRDSVRTFNKHVLNPAMLLFAGRKHWYCAVVRHTGRRSGKRYATPVVAELVSGDTIIVPLPYGADVDWLRNLIAAGRAAITVQGESYEVSAPEVINAAEALPQLSAKRQSVFSRLAIEKFLKVRAAK